MGMESSSQLTIRPSFFRGVGTGIPLNHQPARSGGLLKQVIPSPQDENQLTIPLKSSLIHGLVMKKGHMDDTYFHLPHTLR